MKLILLAIAALVVLVSAALISHPAEAPVAPPQSVASAEPKAEPKVPVVRKRTGASTKAAVTQKRAPAPRKVVPKSKRKPVAKTKKKARADEATIRRDCTGDAMRWCPLEATQAFGGNRKPIIACMIRNKKNVSQQCSQHIG